MAQRVGGRSGRVEVSVRIGMDRPEVQILVVVASIKKRSLKTEVGNGSMTTAVGHGLAGPKEKVNSEKF